MLRHGPMDQLKSLKITAEDTGKELHDFPTHNNSDAYQRTAETSKLSQSVDNLTIQNNEQLIPTTNEYHHGNSDDEETFVYEDHDLTEIPLSVAELISKRQKLRKISLKGNQLSTVPSILGDLSLLYYVNLSHNSFTKVPECIKELQNLEILDMSHNLLTDLPHFLADLPKLIGLSLESNRIQVLPTVIADLKYLVILELDNNNLNLPEELQVSNCADEETWIIALRNYIKSRRMELEMLSAKMTNKIDAASSESRNSSSERTRSTSESGISLRQAKRMGFVMSRNATDQSYVASLHARGLSYDVHLLDSVSPMPPPAVPSSAPSNGNGSPTSESFFHSRTINTLSSEGADFAAPWSPVVRSPYESPWNSPKPAVNDAEPQSSVSSRLSTLAEEHDADTDTADTDPESPAPESTIHNSNNSMSLLQVGANMSSSALKSPIGANPIFKDFGQEQNSDYNNNISGHESNNSGVSTTSSFTENQKYSTRDGLIPEPGLENIRFSLSIFSNFLSKIAPLILPSVETILSEVQSYIFQENVIAALTAFSSLLDQLVSPQIFQQTVLRMNRRQQREFASVILLTFPELEAAWRLIRQSRQIALNAESSSYYNQLRLQDEQLYTQLNFATKQAQIVLNLLNGVVSKSAVAAADKGEAATAMADRIRDLSSVCIHCSGATRIVRKLLDRYNNSQTRYLQLSERRRFWDDVNSFLKAVIATLSAVKAAIPDMPLLADSHVGSEVSSLTRVAKEIPPLLEQSSYRLLLDTHAQSQEDANELSIGVSPVDLVGGPGILPPPTPLTATIGPAAQVLVSPGEQHERPNEGYIQYGLRTRNRTAES